MTRQNEFETPGVSDALPKAVKPLAKRAKKPSTNEILAKIPAPDEQFQPLHIPEKPTQSKTKGLTTPIEYFQLFMSPEWLDQFADWTNRNAIIKRSQRDNEFIKIFTNPEDHKQRNWVYNTWREEIGCFIGCQLLMGVDPKGKTPSN